MNNSSNIYLVSDLHFGAPNHTASLERERHFVKWLNNVAHDASALYLVGDIFDFWFEYRHAVPKGYVRLLGKLAEMSDRGVDIHIFAGNHDLWYRSYFKEQIGAHIHFEPIIEEFFGKKFYLAHGDGLGPGDHGYKLLKFVLTHPLSRWMFERLHPNFGIGLANVTSSLSRGSNKKKPELQLYLKEKEYLYQHVLDVHEKQPDIQYFVFGHRHIVVEDEIVPGANLMILGDWVRHFTYMKVNTQGVTLHKYPMDKDN